MTLNSQNLRINLGCGHIALSGWENLDNSYWIIPASRPRLAEWLSMMGVLRRDAWEGWVGKNVRRVDVRKTLPYPDNSADFVYTSHLLEHLTTLEARALLEECRRILCRGGLLRVVTPDLEHLFRMYNSLKKDFDRDNPQGNIPADHFMRCLGILPEDNRFKRKKHQHKWLYDFDSLYVLLNRAGFGKIHRKSVGEGEMADLDRLEDNYAYPESLFVEAGA